MLLPSSQRPPLKLPKSQPGSVNFFLPSARDETGSGQNVLFRRRLYNRRPSVTLLQGSPQMSLVCPPDSWLLDGSRCRAKVIFEVTYCEQLRVTKHEKQTSIILQCGQASSFWDESFLSFPWQPFKFHPKTQGEVHWVPFVDLDDSNVSALGNCSTVCIKGMKSMCYFNQYFHPILIKQSEIQAALWKTSFMTKKHWKQTKTANMQQTGKYLLLNCSVEYWKSCEMKFTVCN